MTAESGSQATARAPAIRRSRSLLPSPEPSKTAEQIVSEKVIQFGRKRRELAHRIARRTNKPVSAEVEKFFDAIETGKWDDIEAQWKELAKRSRQYGNADDSIPGRDPYWAEVLDTYGVAEQAHLWPAQKLLDYGEAVLGSLRPGMVYVGGTDNGRWVPELLNETSEGEQHIIVTQNALADNTYLDYVKELYGDQVATLSSEDSQRAFQEYLSDAQKRLEHDQQFPDEPKQVRPGENISNADGRMQVSGQVAVMGINEKLLQMLMEKNPSLSFAMEESFPMKTFYSDAVPLGPLLELRASDSQETFTAERATQTLDFWRSQTEAVLADPEATGSDTVIKSWSHEVAAAAHLLEGHNFDAEAEQAYRYANQICPYSPEAVNGLAEVLSRTGRTDEARQLLENFSRRYPNQRSAIEGVWTAVISSSESAGTKP